MINQVCPSCNKKAFSNWEKLHLGPLISKGCSNCNVMLTVPFKLILAYIPLMVTMFIIPYVSYALFLGILPISLIFSFYLQVRYVPLIKAE